jgi:hypothetical protein
MQMNHEAKVAFTISSSLKDKETNHTSSLAVLSYFSSSIDKAQTTNEDPKP